MALAVLEFRVMPSGPEVDLEALTEAIKGKVKEEGGFVNNVEEKPIGFGLKAVNINFSLEESYGTESVEEAFRNVEGVQDIEVVSMSRALS